MAHEKCTEVDARRLFGHLAIANHTQHGGVLGGVTPLQIDRPRDRFLTQRGGIVARLVPWRAVRGAAARPVFDAFVPSLTAISFGACLETPGLGRVWFPGARTVITGRDEFLVTKVGATVLEAEERGLGTTIKYRWSFTTIEDTSAGKVGRRQNRMFDNLTGFSGSAIHPHPSLQTWELIPFKGQLVKAQPECDLAVAGVPKSGAEVGVGSFESEGDAVERAVQLTAPGAIGAPQLIRGVRRTRGSGESRQDAEDRREKP